MSPRAPWRSSERCHGAPSWLGVSAGPPRPRNADCARCFELPSSLSRHGAQSCIRLPVSASSGPAAGSGSRQRSQMLVELFVDESGESTMYASFNGERRRSLGRQCELSCPKRGVPTVELESRERRAEPSQRTHCSLRRERFGGQEFDGVAKGRSPQVSSVVDLDGSEHTQHGCSIAHALGDLADLSARGLVYGASAMWVATFGPSKHQWPAIRVASSSGAG